MRLYNGYKKHYQYQTLLDLLVLLLVFVVITFVIKNYFKPFMTILVLIIASTPVYDIIKKLINKKEIAGTLTILIINILLFCFIFYFGNSIIDLIKSFYFEHIDKIKDFIDNISKVFNIDIKKLLTNNSHSLTSLTFKSGLAITGQSILSYTIANTIRVKKNNLREVVKIELKLVIICIVITIIGFKILRVPSSIFLGVVCGILDILPYVGTIIVFIPIIIYNIIMKEYLLVIGLIALYLLLQIVREILELKFLSSKLDIHPLVVMLSMYIGAEIFGIIGLLVGPIYCLIAKDIIYEGTF